MALLSENLDFNSYSDELWELGAKFITLHGYEQHIDVDSLMMLLWQMQKRIEELESIATPAISGEACDKISTSANE